VRLLLLIAVILLVIDALYYDGGYTQAAHRELSAAVSEVAGWISEEIETRTDEDPPPEPAREPAPPEPLREPGLDRPGD
jgi:hypothetical protein